MDRTSLYRAIAPMLRDGWLVMAKGSDARSRSATITKKGRQILAKAATGWDDIQDRLIRSFGPSAYGSLMVELNRLADCAQGVQK
jgi:DNA-binding MarR family transcriptional regulator